MLTQGNSSNLTGKEAEELLSKKVNETESIFYDKNIKEIKKYATTRVIKSKLKTYKKSKVRFSDSEDCEEE